MKKTLLLALLFGCATNVLAQSKSIEYFNCSGKAEFFNEKNLVSSTNVAYDFAINSTDYELLAKGDIAFSFSGAITKADDVRGLKTVDAQIENLIFTRSAKLMSYDFSVFDLKARKELFRRKVVATCK